MREWRSLLHKAQMKLEEGKVEQFLYTSHSPLFFRKIVEIERFALRAAISDER